MTPERLDVLLERLARWQSHVNVGIPPKASDDARAALRDLPIEALRSILRSVRVESELAHLVWLEDARRRGEIRDWTYRIEKGQIMTEMQGGTPVRLSGRWS